MAVKVVRLRWTPEAVEDLTAIRDHLLETHPEWLEKTMMRLERDIEALLRFPELGRKTERSNVRALPIRILPYLCIYTERDDSIIVLNIFHGAQQRPRDLR